MEQPLFSIVIAAYNYGRYIEQAVESALAQHLEQGSFEVIVVDDGSTDDTSEKIARYRDRVHLLQQENLGQVAAYQAGIRAARGKYTALLDADDYYYPGKLAAVLKEFHRETEPGVVYNRFDRIGESGEVIESALPRKIRMGDLAALTRYGVITGAPTSGISAHTSLLVHYPPPPHAWRTGLDHFYLHILPLVAPVGFATQPLHAYRQHGGSQFTSQDRNLQRELSRQRQRLVWAYAREVLGTTFWDEVRAACEDRQSDPLKDRLRAYGQAAAWVWRDRAPAVLRAWALAKLTARCALSPALYDCLRAVLHRLTD
jgi:glycosyltransferase involved in cell wall biosynthesis